MLKIDYILLVKHFQGETLFEENETIFTWKNENIINALTYKRLKSLYFQEKSFVEKQEITKEETKSWKAIITKILKEEVKA